MPVNNKGYQAGVLVDGTDLRFTTTLHRLVAKAFVPGYAPGLTVNHIDGVKIHNLPANLEWCSIQDNIQHAFETGLRKWVSPELRAEMLALSAAGMPNAHIAKQVGTSASTADNVCGSAHIKWVTKEQKEAVRLERWALGTPYKKLAEKHRISKTHVCRICKGIQVNEMVYA
jgi:DNA-binding CsgD family transcriptional regulator